MAENKEIKSKLATKFFNAASIGDVPTCIDIIDDENFDPNATVFPDEPIIMSLLYGYTMDMSPRINHCFKEIVSMLIDHKDFDVNACDSFKENVLYTVARNAALNVFAEKLLAKEGIDLEHKNDIHYTVMDVARINKNKTFYDMLMGGNGEDIITQGMPHFREIGENE